ncbi:MAG: Rrf2 family transcriptional regulator [Burkholderiaceae bacterium]|nr:Rrf2 family transcriptional regulator [Burkholderiaceae bacterium]
MRLQKNTSLALYSVLEFAIDPSRHIPASEIAEKYGVSPHHLAKVLSELARSGFVESVRGVGGGYRFAGNARRITLMDIIQLFEDFATPSAERREPSESTPVGMALGAVMFEIDEIAKATLGSITLATMLRLIERQQGRPLGPAAQVNGAALRDDATPDEATQAAAGAATNRRKPRRAPAARRERGRTTARPRS